LYAVCWVARPCQGPSDTVDEFYGKQGTAKRREGSTGHGRKLGVGNERWGEGEGTRRDGRERDGPHRF